MHIQNFHRKIYYHLTCWKKHAEVLLFFVRCIYRIPRALRRHSRMPGEFVVVVVRGCVGVGCFFKGLPISIRIHGIPYTVYPFATHGTAILWSCTYMNGLNAYGKGRWIYQSHGAYYIYILYRYYLHLKHKNQAQGIDSYQSHGSYEVSTVALFVWFFMAKPEDTR